MDGLLADELLEKILIDLLHVPDLVFREPSVNLYAVLDPNYWQSSSLLLVNKRWLNVATPLLYNTVMLRTRAQAQALEEALSENKPFASKVKRLRVDAVWPNLGKIVVACTNIEVLFMVLDVHLSTPVDRLCFGISGLNPVQVILCDLHRLNNRKLRQILTTIAIAIRKWTNLTTFTLPKLAHKATMENVALARALSASTSLRHIYAEAVSKWPTTWKSFEANSAINLHLRKARGLTYRIPDSFPENLKSRTFIFLSPWASASKTSRKARVSRGRMPIQPLLRQPMKVQYKIFSLIFSYIIVPRRDLSPCVDSEYISNTYGLKTMRKNLSLTCKIFYIFVKLLTNQAPLCISQRGFLEFVNTVRLNSDLGQQVEALTLGFTKKIDPRRFNAELWHLLPHLRPLPNVTRGLQYFNAKGTSLDGPNFWLLTQTVGQTIVDLCITSVGPLNSDDLQNLRAIVHLLNFPLVERLSLGLSDLSTVWLLTMTKFPSLSTLVLTGNSENRSIPIELFLERHGSRLVELEVEGRNDPIAYNHCPILRVLRLSGYSHILRREIFKRFTHHAHLEHIIVHQPLQECDLNIMYEEDSRPNIVRPFFEALNFTGFPNMRKLELLAYSWPATGDEIATANIPRYALSLRDKHKVEIIDRNGRTWRRRVCR